MARTLLVVGAQGSSIGSEVAREASTLRRWDSIVTAGVSGDEYVRLDVERGSDVSALMGVWMPDDVVCTVGINRTCTVGDTLRLHSTLVDHMMVNFLGPMRLLSEWLRVHDEPCDDRTYNFVAIGSNSAHIARTQSVAYCASKAALSMGIRVAGREFASVDGTNIYGYEPGFITDTPMSAQWQSEDHPNGVVPHRIPGGRAMHREDLAHLIVANLCNDAFGRSANGTMIRLDGGEQ